MFACRRCRRGVAFPAKTETRGGGARSGAAFARRRSRDDSDGPIERVENLRRALRGGGDFRAPFIDAMEHALDEEVSKSVVGDATDDGFRLHGERQSLCKR